MGVQRRGVTTAMGKSPDLRERTKRFALDIIKYYSNLPKTEVLLVIGRQLLRSGTSVGAHHREASRGRSAAEFVSKMQCGLQELDETDYWLELSIEVAPSFANFARSLRAEAQELMAMFAASVRTAKSVRQP